MANKAALLVALLFSSLLVCFWFFAFFIVGSLGARHLWQHLGVLGTERAVLIVGLAWFILRVTDFLAGGATYRLFCHKLAPASPGSNMRLRLAVADSHAKTIQPL